MIVIVARLVPLSPPIMNSTTVVWKSRPHWLGKNIMLINGKKTYACMTFKIIEEN